MASSQTALSLSVDQYLQTSFRPDVDFVDDHIEERNVGEYDHAILQMALSAFFHQNRKQWNIRVAPELRVQTGERRFRVPDVCIVSTHNPKEQIARLPPLLCIEVLSPRDSLRSMRSRVQDFFTMAVPQVWIFDPQSRVVTVCTPDSMTAHRSGILSLPGTPITLDIAPIFSALDED